MEQEGGRQIAYIFQYLSVKTLLRCRCLSKWHLSKIDNPNFAILYGFFSAAYDTRSRRLFLQFHRPTAAAAAPIGFCPFSHQACPSQGFPGRYSVVGGSFFGVLCLASSPFDVCLWNPSTRTHRHIIPPKYVYHDSDGDGAFRRVNFGLGCNRERDTKLARLVFSFSPKTRAFIGEASVYTVHSDTWQTIKCQMMWPANSYIVRREFLWEFGKSGVSVKYRIKWAVKLDDTQNGVRQFAIMSLNLNRYTFSAESIPELMMEGRSSDSLLDIDLWPFTGSACIAFQFGGESSEVVIWVQDMENWSTVLTVKGFFWRLKPLFYSTDKKKVLLQMDSRLVWYDLTTKEYWNSDVLQDGSLLYDASVFLESCELINGVRRCLRS